MADVGDAEALAAEVEALTREVEDLRAEATDNRARLDALQLDVVELVEHLGSTSGRKTAPPVYPDWSAWVREWLTPRTSRSPHVKWCRRYDEHPEVADRLEALWHAWESSWPEPLNRLAWYRDGLDHQFAHITAPDGPLRQCSAHEGQHVSPPPLGPGPPSGDDRQPRVDR